MWRDESSVVNTKFLAHIEQGGVLMKRILVSTIIINLAIALLAMSQTKNKKPDQGSDVFQVAPKDTNRSIVFGYFEYEDLRYDIMSRSKEASYDSAKGEDMATDVLFKTVTLFARDIPTNPKLIKELKEKGGTLYTMVAQPQVLRMWRATEKYEKAKLKGKTDKVVEAGIPVEITDIRFEKSNISDKDKKDKDIRLKPSILNNGRGFLVYFTNVPAGDWQILTLSGIGVPVGYYKIDSTPEYDDFIPVIPLSSVNFIADSIAVNIPTRGVYCVGSYRVSETRNLTLVSKSTYERGYKKESLAEPSEKQLLQELLKLSTGSAWEQMIKQRLAKIEK